LSGRPALLVNALLALAVLAAGLWAYFFVTGSPTSAAADDVRTTPVLQGTVTATASADGSVESASTASASFETSGTVTEILVGVGQTVKKGQPLAKVDPTAAKRDLAAAEADLSAAVDALALAEEADGDTSQAQAQVTEAELAVDEAEAGVAGTVLKAPMAGTVVAVNGVLGGSAAGSSGSSSGGADSGGGPSSGGATTDDGSSTGSTGFIDLADLSRLQVTAGFAEVDATRIAEGQQATVSWNALAGTEVAATVAAIDPNATTANSVVTYQVTLELAEVPAAAKPGQSVAVSVVTGTAENAVYVNSAAVTSVGNRHSVTVLADDGQEVTRSVEVGLAGDQFIEITSGLVAGEQVVVTVEDTTGGTNGGGPAGAPPGGGLTGGGFPGGGRPGGGGAPAGGGR
jgi:macrolide-specific efflux system membrane fusion protein